MKLSAILSLTKEVTLFTGGPEVQLETEILSITHRVEMWKEGVIFADFGRETAPPDSILLTSTPREGHSGLQLICENLKTTSRNLSLIIHKEAIESNQLVAVTGTNGKTSVVHMARQLSESNDVVSYSLGTLGIHGNGLQEKTPNTTNLPLDLHPLFTKVHQQGSGVIFMEASSIGLREGRLDGLNFFASGWTNLSQDHLDVHGSMEIYWKDKLRLLKLNKGKIVCNLDNTYTESLRKEERSLTYSTSDSSADYYFKEIKANEDGFQLNLIAEGESIQTEVTFLGRHNLSNLLCAMGMVNAIGISFHEMATSLPSISLPRGRFDRAETRAQGRTYIDYAHSPEGLEKTLLAAREHFPNHRIKVLFGCGGDRDRNKRAPMGEIAERLADEIWLTSDNSRSEPTSSILHDIIEGMKTPPHFMFEDREEAIYEALSSMEDSDVLLICGKGHETEQVLGDTTLTLDEYSCCKNF